MDDVDGTRPPFFGAIWQKITRWFAGRTEEHALVIAQRESESAYLVEVTLGDVAPQDLHIGFSGNTVTFSVRRTLPVPFQQGTRSRPHVQNQTIRFHNAINADRAHCTYEDGKVLVRIPKM